MSLSLIIILFIIIGFFVIIDAPPMKIFRKAGKKPWLAIIPGLNVLNYIRITGKPLLILSVLPVLAVWAYMGQYVWFSNLLAQDNSLLIFGYAFGSLLLIIVLMSLLHMFPGLATILLIMISFIAPINETMIISALVILALGCVQLIWDVLGWFSLLRRLKRPLWQIAFFLVPFSVALFNAIYMLIAGRTDNALLIATLVPVFFACLIYFYYLGYSAKVIYQKISKE